MPPKTTDADLPEDPFKRAIYVYDKLTDLISQQQMISKTFLKPKRALTDIYAANAFRQLADDVSKQFGIQISPAEVRKAETLEGLSLAIVDKLSDK
jgi:hypothetical protein